MWDTYTPVAVGAEIDRLGFVFRKSDPSRAAKSELIGSFAHHA
jgi:hypothetical protein